MTITDQLETLRKYWHAEGCTKEEKYALNITAAALKNNERKECSSFCHQDEKCRITETGICDTIQRRIERHQLRFETANYQL